MFPELAARARFNELIGRGMLPRWLAYQIKN
jgi:hypothetical protein